MIKMICKGCGNGFEVTEEDTWKTLCMDCFLKTKPESVVRENTPKKEIIGLDETTKRIMFGNCLNASGMALSGTGTTPELHYSYAKQLYELWTRSKI